MGKRIKKNVKGEASQYLTRSNAIRKLQLSLQDFRRVCILKGVYPREPKRKYKGNTKTYFHIKDIKILEHDQLLDKFRAIQAHMKKHKKLLGRREVKLAEKHITKTPTYSLINVIKDRYPSFVDALRDIDDALCMVALFSQLHQHETLSINKKDLEECKNLYRDFMLYCTVAQNFQKAFFSIKGMYYRVEIMGQQITWVQPYQFNQRLPFDVDYKVMGTFLEFYLALLKFVNFKLFSDLGLQYPMVNYPNAADYLDCKQVQAMQKVARQKFSDAEEENDVVDAEFANTPEFRQMQARTQQSRKQKKLLTNCVFQLNREVPTYILQYLVLSFGGSFIMKDHLDDMTDEKAKQAYKQVTHVVMDRPLPATVIASAENKGKEFIQPQYLADSVNNLVLLPTRPYKPGVPSPPHLSPFVENETQGYIPDRQREINNLTGVVTAEPEEQSEDESDEEIEKESGSEESDDGKGDADSSSEEEIEVKETKKSSKTDKEKQQKKFKKLKKDLEVEQQEMGKMLMTNRQRKLYQAADKEKKKMKDQAKLLKEKKKKLSSKK